MAKVLAEAAEQPLDRRLVGHVGRIVLALASCFRAEPYRRLEFCVIDVDQCELCALAGDELRHLLTEPLRSPGDHNNLSVQIHFHAPMLLQRSNRLLLAESLIASYRYFTKT